jgi:1-phosphofructokinase family hexose kinase
MILCVTPNPAIDRTLLLPELVPGQVHRAARTIVAAGGKGLNVARAIRTLGGEPLCMGFAGGHAGRLLSDLAQEDGLPSAWTWTESETRICTILVPEGAGATEIDEPGLPVSKSDWERLHADIAKRIPSAELVCLSGSLPPGSSLDDFDKLLDIALGSGKPVWADTSGPALDAALASPGACIKVNEREISRSLGLEAGDLPGLQRAVKRLIANGLAACAVTLGAAGAMLATPDGNWRASGPTVQAVNATASGDSFLGGLVTALAAGRDWPASLRDAVAAGTANALSLGGGKFGLVEFRHLRERFQVRPW